MRLTTGEVRDQITRKYRKLEHNNKKNAVKSFMTHSIQTLYV